MEKYITVRWYQIRILWKGSFAFGIDFLFSFGHLLWNKNSRTICPFLSHFSCWRMLWKKLWGLKTDRKEWLHPCGPLCIPWSDSLKRDGLLLIFQMCCWTQSWPVKMLSLRTHVDDCYLLHFFNPKVGIRLLSCQHCTLARHNSDHWWFCLVGEVIQKLAGRW